MVNSLKGNKREGQPLRLYHYTTLESLALILENKTLRLMPISGMDDVQESRTSDIPNLGSFVFVSSWTDDPTESIPMWNMYASLEAGVRISLPSMPFRRYRLTKEEFAREVGLPVDHVTMEGEFFESFLPPSDLAKGLSTPSFLTGEDVLVRVLYTSNPDLLEPRVLSLGGEKADVAIGMLGKCKNEYWEFQHEWRYRLEMLPFNPFGLPEDAAARFGEMAAKLMLGILPAPCPYYDLTISDEALGEFEVVASPKMSAGNKLLLNLLLEKHGLEESLRRSELTGLL